MRLDKFLKLSRLIKRRTEAKKACQGGYVKINDKIAKAGDEIKISDRMEIEFKDRFLMVEIIQIPAGNISIHQASSLYRIIKEIKKVEPN